MAIIIGRDACTSKFWNELLLKPCQVAFCEEDEDGSSIDFTATGKSASIIQDI